MDKTGIYIQKLIVLILVFTAGVLLFPLVKIYFLLPVLFFTLAFLVSRITGQKPEFLFGLAKADDFLNKKAGFWILLKWIVMLLGLITDLLVWTIYGVYVLFTMILDLILLIKTVLFYIIHALLWFLKLFVPPLVFIYKMVIYYLFLWNWWIYKISFNNIRKSINRNFYFISLRGAILMLFVMGLFYGVGVLMGIIEITFVGLIFSVLPLVWSFGEISSLRLRNGESDSNIQVRNNFQSGFDAVRAVLSYFIIFLVLAIVEVVFNLLGWIPQVGFSFMGLALNINTLASLILVFVFVILVFAKLIMPPHVVYNKDFTSDLNGSISFLGVIGRRFLRYIVSTIPAGFFGLAVIVIPALIVFLSLIITLNVKNSILDTRISILTQRLIVLDGLEKYKTNKNIQRIAYYKEFPKNSFTDFAGLKSLNINIKNLKDNILKGEEEIRTLSMEFSTVIDSLDKKIEKIKFQPMADSASSEEILRLEAIRHSRLNNFGIWKQEGELSLSKMKIDLADKQGYMIQLPIVFLFCILGVSFFLGLVIAFFISYLGNVYFELYNFKEDEKPTYFRQVISELNADDRNQPLLGFTLIAILAIALYYRIFLLRFIELFI